MDAQSSNAQPSGHQLKVDDLLIEIYELLSYFLSSRPIAELERSNLYGGKDPVHQFGVVERDLITNRLISIAIKIRILDDRQPKFFDMFTDYCGTITKDRSKPIETIGIGLRDACNKVIHARKVDFDMSSAENGLSYLNPYIFLEGTESGKPWVTSLDVVKFCRESAAAMRLVK